MKKFLQIAGAGALLMGTMGALRAAAQDPVITPAVISTVAPEVIDTVVPIVVSAVKPKPKNDGLVKFEGTVLHANRAQITVKAKGNDMAVQSFALSTAAAEKMQLVINQGGYQYGDKIKLEYDPQSKTVMKFKGKPSKPL